MVIDHKFEKILPMKERLEEISGREYPQSVVFWNTDKVYTPSLIIKKSILYSESAGGVRYRVLHSKSMNFARSTNALCEHLLVMGLSLPYCIVVCNSFC